MYVEGSIINYMISSSMPNTRLGQSCRTVLCRLVDVITCLIEIVWNYRDNTLNFSINTDQLPNDVAMARLNENTCSAFYHNVSYSTFYLHDIAHVRVI